MRSIILAAACVAGLTLTACSQAKGSVDAPTADEATTPAPAEDTGATASKPGTPAPPVPTAPTAAKPQATAYTPVPISRDDQPGRARQIRCQVGSAPETDCTFTPLFGDGSFQLDGPDIALRMVISDGEGGLFEVIGPEERIAIGGTYRRDSRDRACWIANEETPAPSRVCAR
ncbi:hypothetical protein MMB232_02566 [Brevundimonas subvibrioides]|uniref:hypothetical protein n=1 Tax=Brevundimonas subvibrioides TaxID=74313 RepID=UPI0032D56EDE